MTPGNECEARNLVGVIGPICNSPRVGNGLNGVGLGGMFSDRSDKNIQLRSKKMVSVVREESKDQQDGVSESESNLPPI